MYGFKVVSFHASQLPYPDLKLDTDPTAESVGVTTNTSNLGYSHQNVSKL